MVNPYNTEEQPRHNLLKWLVIFIVITGLIIFFIKNFSQEKLPEKTIINEQPNSSSNSNLQSDDISLEAKKILQQSINASADDKYFLTLDSAKTKAKTSEDAILICSLNDKAKYRNYCLQEMAEESLDPSFCEIIAEPKQKDDCYMQLILKGEDQYCSKLILDDSKEFCELLLNS